MAARPRSASASTMDAFCPPISAWTRPPRPATRATTSRPTGTEPVNDTAATSGWSASARPGTASPSTTWKTSAGRCGATISCSSSATPVAAPAGFSTVALPNARLGAAFHSGMATGKFHGVISAVTPTGRCRASSSVPGGGRGNRLPVGQQRQLGVVAQDGDAAGHLPRRLRARLADLPDDQFGHLAGPRPPGHPRRCRAPRPGPGRPRAPSPCAAAAARPTDGRHLRLVRGGPFADDVGRVVRVHADNRHDFTSSNTLPRGLSAPRRASQRLRSSPAGRIRCASTADGPDAGSGFDDHRMTPSSALASAKVQVDLAALHFSDPETGESLRGQS